MAVQTQYEINGAWSSNDFGESFMQTIASETNADLKVIGQSVRGRELHKLSVGTGDNQILITSGVHGNEPASREVILMKARDVAYNTSGEYDAFLNEHTIHFVPTMNPDQTGVSYRNAENIDINRVAYKLNSPEGVAFMNVLMEIDPDIYLDFHERGGTTSRDIEFVRAMHEDPNSDTGIRNTIQKMFDDITPELETDGFNVGYYPPGGVGFGSLTSGAGILGFPTFTTETWLSGDHQTRINAQKSVFDKMLNWYQENKILVKDTKSDFESNMSKAGDAFVLLNGMSKGSEMYNQANREIIELPYGYKLNDVSDISDFIDIYKFHIDDDGVIPVNQRIGRMLPHLLDPDSDMKVADAFRIEPEEPEKRTDGRYTKVLYDNWKEVFIKYM